jgi:hypothetical protein
MGWATLWVIFSQARLVTLFAIKAFSDGDGFLCSAAHVGSSISVTRLG